MSTLFPLPRPKCTLEARRASLIKRLLRVAAILQAYEDREITIRDFDGTEEKENYRDADRRFEYVTTKLEKWLRALECCLLDRDPAAPEPYPINPPDMGQHTRHIGDLRREWNEAHPLQERSYTPKPTPKRRRK